ncbi:MAG: selenium cofactor biosynthesis protein YqeC [Fusobacterium sp.]|uniref:selenium cofactor biosynthesis protein YqeC n=1 Tax=Fusobacterium sp. TaxID=68766 RepID=UPI003992DC10
MSYRNFNIDKKDIVAITGAGGKTSLIFFLAKKLAQFGKVLITTTTKMYKPSSENYETLKIGDKNYLGKEKNISIIAKSEINGKITSLSYEEIEKLKDNFDYILIEADGAKEKLLKFWNDTEPCIPNFVTKVIGVINCEIFNQDFNENNIHRFNLVPENLLDFINKKIDADFLSRYILSADYFKDTPSYAEKFIFFNGIDGENQLDKLDNSLKTISKISKEKDFPNIILGSIKNSEFYPYQKVDAVVMASGFSKRMGFNKLKLEYNNISLLENCLKKLSSIPFNEVLVCGREEWIKSLSEKYSFKYLNNLNAHLGQSESIKLGVKNSSGKSITFFTADQPLLSEKTILTLYYNFLKTNLITIPIVNNNRFSPVFFPDEKKAEFLKLKGDSGGKPIIKNSSLINLISFSFEKEFSDIDTEEDYNNIKKGY